VVQYFVITGHIFTADSTIAPSARRRARSIDLFDATFCGQLRERLHTHSRIITSTKKSHRGDSRRVSASARLIGARRRDAITAPSRIDRGGPARVAGADGAAARPAAG
jgi:hypothetical protein